MMTGTAGRSCLRIRVSSRPFMSHERHGKVRDNQSGLKQERLVDGLLAVFGFAADFKVRFARK